ncbi:MAG: ribosome maturation factor RimP [Desulfobacterales bacterium]|nr:ribosome maturation factor RimP [Desulfobacterales bacterium]
MAQLKAKRKKHGRNRGAANVIRKPRVSPEKLEKAATALVEPVCTAAGLELVLVEFRREPVGRVLRLYIDRPADGVTLDDCTHISRQVTDLLDVSMEGLGRYNLEVSSPGSQRPLVKPADYQRFAGQPVRIRLHEPVNGQKNFKGAISAATDETVEIETATGTVSFDFAQIAITRLNG